MTSRDLITSYLTAARSGDWATAYGCFADDLRIRIPGRSGWAGERVGKEHAMAYIDAALERHAGRVEVELVDMLVSDERVVLIVRERFLGDAPVEITRANAYTVRDGRIVAIEIFEGDQYAVDEHVHRPGRVRRRRRRCSAVRAVRGGSGAGPWSCPRSRHVTPRL